MIRVLLTTAVSITPLLAQTTVSIICDRDNTLYESPTGALSAGAHNALYCGVTAQSSGTLRRAIMRFDVAGAVPAGALIVSADLTVNVVQSAAFPPIDVNAHRVLADWGEGTSLPTGGFGGGGAGGPSTTNSVTWIHTFWPGSTWTNAGGDFAAAPSFTFATPPFGTATSATTAGALADVQNWLDNPGQNFGWLLKTDELVAATARRLDSRESTTGTKPTLTVTYLMNGQATAYGTGCPVGVNTFTHAWAGNPIGGTTIQLTLQNGPPSALAANLMSIGFDPVGTALHPSCNLNLPIFGVVNLGIFPLDGTGAASNPFAVPAGFTGLLLASQSAAIDGNNPAGFVLSNAVLALLQ